MRVILPQELSDAVIDCLQGDRRALEACSLTCIGWTSHARTYLFRQVRLHRRRESLLLLSALESSAQAGTRIGEYVLDLALPDSWGRRSQKSRSIPVRCALVTEILRYVPNVERLSMRGFDWSAIELAASLQQAALSAPVSFDEADSDASQHVSADPQLPAPSILPHLPRLNTLCLYNSAICFISTVEAVARHFVAFPQLRTLDIKQMRYQRDAPRAAQSDQAAGITPVIRISELKMDSFSCRDDIHLDWISSPLVLLDLRKLDVSLNFRGRWTRRFVEFVEGTRCSMLEELSISTFGMLRSYDNGPILDLSRYSHLRSLYVSSSIDTSHFIVRLLSSYSRHELRKIHVRLNIVFGRYRTLWASFYEWLDTVAESLISFSRRCLQGSSVTMDLHVDSPRSFADLGVHDTPQRVNDRLVPLLTAAAITLCWS